MNERLLKPNSIIRILFRAIKMSLPVSIYLANIIIKPKLLKYFAHWIYSNLDAFGSPLKGRVPWVAYESKEWIDEFFSRNRNQELIVFEWGSGVSTLYFSQKASRVISIEHDVAWFPLVNSILQQEKILNCTYLLVEPQSFSGSFADPSDPKSYKSHEYGNTSFNEYVKSIDFYPNQYFDVIFIDGRARPSCLMHALSKVKPGGIIILDNSDRDYYSQGKELLNDFAKINFFGPAPYGKFFWQTTIWQIPLVLKNTPIYIPSEF
jgi:hypothetical protein